VDTIISYAWHPYLLTQYYTKELQLVASFAISYNRGCLSHFETVPLYINFWWWLMTPLCFSCALSSRLLWA